MAKHAPVLVRLHEAMNRHDLEAFLACFDPEYESQQPLHPDRAFGGVEQVRKNWSTLFAGIPDFKADLLSSSSDGEAVWGEWDWRGTKGDGSSFWLRGVTIFRVENERLRWGRLYMEPVEVDGAGIDAAVKRAAGGDRGLMEDANALTGIGSDAERMAQLVVEFTVPDLEAALQFYTAVGFTLERRDGAFAVLSWRGERQLFLDEDPRLGVMPRAFVNVRVIVPDVDEVWAKVQELGAAVVQPIGDRRYGLRDFTVSDPAGFGVRFATPIRA